MEVFSHLNYPQRDFYFTCSIIFHGILSNNFGFACTPPSFGSASKHYSLSSETFVKLCHPLLIGLQVIQYLWE